MHVGVCHLTLRLAENHSLKGKRQVIKSLLARLANEFNVSVAETDQQEAWQLAGIGLCCVSNSRQHAQQQLQAMVEFVEHTRPDVEIVECELDVLSA
ncbi:MAG TPA: DUF503 domain-containing protein [Dehalococcoidia bacterium]|nr:DUF503 domain-containing protein [Dehalococcoidia bacterium]